MFVLINNSKNKVYKDGYDVFGYENSKYQCVNGTCKEFTIFIGENNGKDDPIMVYCLEKG